MTASFHLTQLTSISWREPLWLSLTVLPIILVSIRTRLQPKHARYAETHLMTWASAPQDTTLRGYVFSKNSAFIIAWLLFSISASGPRLPLELATPDQPGKLDIMLVIDVSRSMHVNDIAPSRLRRAQIEIDELISRSTGSRFGIIVFAARPHLLTPLTSDMSALRFYLHMLDTLTLPTTGSEPLAALKLARTELDNSINPTAILMLSDGDFVTSPIPTDTSASEKNNNPPLYILGLGTSEGAAIPLKNGQWLRHDGQSVISRLNEKSLRTLSSRGLGPGQSNRRYSLATDDNRDWQQLYDDGIARLATQAISADQKQKIIWQQLYHWPLCAAVLLLWISLMPYRLVLPTHPGKARTIPNGKSMSSLRTEAATTARLLFLSCSLIFLSLYPAQNISADQAKLITNGSQTNSTQAYKNYREKNYAAAISIYKQLTGYAARFAEGASHYQLENYANAARQFSLAILAAENDQQRANALFNLGNSYFQAGDYSNAITAFSDTLKYQPTDKRAQHNLDFSAALKKSVEKRQRITAKAARMGSGPQLSPSEQSVNTNSGGSLAIDESESQTRAPLPELADLSNSILENLINKGLEHIQLAATQNNAENIAAQQRRKLSLINARLRMSELDDQHTLLWKRLFEMEEGFPAPLAEPRIIPGVAPW